MPRNMHRTARRTRLVPTILALATALLVSVWSPVRADAAYPTPSGFRVLSSTTTSVSLDWTKVSGASGYRVRYATVSAMTDAKGAAFRYSNGVVTGLRPGTTYYFRIAVAAKYGTGAAQSAYTRAPYLTGRTQALPPSGTSGSFDLRTASFNISGILNDASAPEPWSVRRTPVARQLLGLQPAAERSAPAHVIALQEANTTKAFGGGTQYTDLVDALNANAPSGYHYSTIPGITSLATRIAYDDSALQLVDAGALRWDAQETKVDGLRYFPWAIFQIRSTGSRFFFGSAHLETASESVRRAQWQQLVTVLPTLSRGLPAVFGGDFNSPRGSASGTLSNPTASVMLPKMGPAGYPDTLGQAGRGTYYISRSRAQHVVRGNINSVNRFQRSLGYYPNTDIIGQSVDYLFASRSLTVKDWAMVVDDSGDYGLDGTIPSDHNMIRATVTVP